MLQDSAKMESVSRHPSQVGRYEGKYEVMEASNCAAEGILQYAAAVGPLRVHRPWTDGLSPRSADMMASGVDY
jgi:hypothetical protein